MSDHTSLLCLTQQYTDWSISFRGHSLFFSHGLTLFYQGCQWAESQTPDSGSYHRVGVCWILLSEEVQVSSHLGAPSLSATCTSPGLSDLSTCLHPHSLGFHLLTHLAFSAVTHNPLFQSPTHLVSLWLHLSSLPPCLSLYLYCKVGVMRMQHVYVSMVTLGLVTWYCQISRDSVHKILCRW
jgi:hypothetical protein